ncbi:MAG: hypothetical protein KGI41_01245 [Patescibacteria group bacterium]|nr:hypothetical protein [Patescibacteria group bacterium]MDE1965852.1 hypothetical protein [Patescibacteria group bacterium]
MNNSNSESNLRTVGLIALGVGIGMVVTVVWYSSPSDIALPPAPGTGADTVSAASATSTPSLPQDASGAVSVKDQAAGDSVIVESVTVPPPGVWVVVHEYHGSERGNALGARYVRGPSINVVVPLLRATVQGGTYAVVLYRDNGDGAFNLADDSVYVDFDTGQPVVAPFSTFAN